MTDLLSHAADLGAPRRFPWIADGIAFGADYSPEQWPEQVQLEDLELMRRAGVTNVSLAIFSWVLVEPSDGEFEWSWLDGVMGRLHEHGIGVNLATPTAAPPMWLMRAHPEIATVDEAGHRTGAGGRLGWAASSATFRRYALRLVERMAQRYADHPALRLWHVSNEIGNENGSSHGTETAAAWRVWLTERHGGIEAVNAAWGTDFWGHRYDSLEQVEPPRAARTQHNPGMLLDWRRFTSDSLLAHYVAERDVLREHSPGVPVTTNFMVSADDGAAEYSRWAAEVDVLANDHYTIGDDPHRHRELELCADRSRGMVDGRPWMLMEHAAGAVNWQPFNRAKDPGEMMRDTLAHVARGADGVLFFQWRASSAGSEQWHSGLVPHAGPDSRHFRDVCRLGEAVRALAPVQGSVVPRAEVAMLVDEQSAWALGSTRLPTTLLRPLDVAAVWHRALGDATVAVDVIPSRGSFEGRRVLLLPTQYVVDAALAARLRTFVEEGGHLLVGFASGVVDETNRVLLGGYPGALRDLLGMRVEEVRPLLPGDGVALASGGTASLWTEELQLDDAEVLDTYAEGPLAGAPALTRARRGSGTATYVSCRADDATMASAVRDAVGGAGVTALVDVEGEVAVTRRVADDGRSFLFLINSSTRDARVHGGGVDLLTGERSEGLTTVPAGGVVVLEEGSAAEAGD